MAYTLPQPTLADAGLPWVVVRRGGSVALAAFLSTWETAEFLLTRAARGERCGVGHARLGWADMSPHEDVNMTQDALADWLATWHDEMLRAGAG